VEQKNDKPQRFKSAEVSLEAIDRALQKGLLSQENAFKMALVIKKGFDAREKLGGIKRWVLKLLHLTSSKQRVNTLYQKIYAAGTPSNSLFLYLPEEIQLAIFEEIPLKDLSQLRLTNKEGKRLAEISFQDRFSKLTGPNAATFHRAPTCPTFEELEQRKQKKIQALSEMVFTLKEKLPSRCLVFEEQNLNWEKTLYQLKTLTNQELLELWQKRPDPTTRRVSMDEKWKWSTLISFLIDFSAEAEEEDPLLKPLVTPASLKKCTKEEAKLLFKRGAPKQDLQNYLAPFFAEARAIRSSRDVEILHLGLDLLPDWEITVSQWQVLFKNLRSPQGNHLYSFITSRFEKEACPHLATLMRAAFLTKQSHFIDPILSCLNDSPSLIETYRDILDQFGRDLVLLAGGSRNNNNLRSIQKLGLDYNAILKEELLRYKNSWGQEHPLPAPLSLFLISNLVELGIDPYQEIRGMTMWEIIQSGPHASHIHHHLILDHCTRVFSQRHEQSL
jgi:hypothetical protein